MNAYSSIGKRRVSGASRRLHSRAYRAGLRDGFGATASFFLPTSFDRFDKTDSSIEKAWKTVGDAMRDALADGGKLIGKNTRTTETAD